MVQNDTIPSSNFPFHRYDSAPAQAAAAMFFFESTYPNSWFSFVFVQIFQKK